MKGVLFGKQTRKRKPAKKIIRDRLSGYKGVQHEEQKYLFVSDNLNITVSNCKDIFMWQKNEELNMNDVLNIEIKDMKMKTKEKKEMTQKEVFEFLKNKKIRCESKEESEKVQKKLFELGYAFRNSGKKILSTYLLYIIDNFKLLVENYYDSWVKNESKMIEPSEILAIKIKEEKPKFDPSTLQPFDRVLVRQGKHVEWVARFFDFCEDDNYYTTSGSAWVMCVPYNEETKHLHGTAEEEPEFYNIWE